MSETPEGYAASIEWDLIAKRWVIRVRYVRSRTVGGRPLYGRFILVPQHQGEPFAQTCESVKKAIELHREKGGRAIRPGYSS